MSWEVVRVDEKNGSYSLPGGETIEHRLGDRGADAIAAA
jgi:hypothetical protein